MGADPVMATTSKEQTNQPKLTQSCESQVSVKTIQSQEFKTNELWKHYLAKALVLKLPSSLSEHT